MRIYFIAFFILLIMWAGVPTAAADEVLDTEPVFPLESTLYEIDLSVWEDYKKNIDQEIDTYMAGKPLQDWILEFVRGDWEFSLKDLTSNVLHYFFKEIGANSGLLSKLLVLSVLSALVINLSASLGSSIAKVAYFACFMAISAIALGSFKLVLDIGVKTVDDMSGFMVAMLPQMMVLVTGLGNVNASVMLFPVLMMASTAFANAVKNIVFPLIIMSALLNIANNMSETIQVNRLAKFFGQMAQIALGFFLTLFVGLMTLRALYASAIDKVALRTTKFVTDNAIPVVGKMFSDTIEVAAGYIVLIKQALGVFGVLAILSILIFPLIKIIVIGLIYRIAGAVAEPLGDPRTAAILEIMSAHLFLLLAAVAAVALMFFVMIAIIAGMSNHLALLR